MAKIKAFDLTLTAAAFAALVFLLPADRDRTAASVDQSYTPSSHQGHSKTADQEPIRGQFLHTT